MQIKVTKEIKVSCRAQLGQGHQQSLKKGLHQMKSLPTNAMRRGLNMLMRRFHDVCINHTTLEIQYYVEPTNPEAPLFYHYLNGQPHYKFPPDFVMTGHVHILPYMPWAPKVSLHD